MQNKLNNRIMKVGLAVTFGLMNNIAFSQDDMAIVKSLNQLLQETQSMQASFSQTTAVNKPKQTQQRSGMSGLKVTGLNKNFSGNMMVQRPNQFRWHTKSPAEQIIVANKKTLWIYDPDLEQATKQQVDKQFSNTPALLLSGNQAEIIKNFRVTQPKSDVDTFVLYPKSENATFESMALAFNQGIPKAMVLKDALGQVTTIKFSNVKLNKKISDSQFKFTVPEGVDIIEQ